MREYRQNPLTGNWVVIAPDRGKRPQEYPAEAKSRPMPEYEETCDFCPGHEGRTEAELYAVRDDYATADQEGWRVRVVPNKYPAATLESPHLPAPPADRKEPLAGSPGSALRTSQPASGLHEVIVESPFHNKHFSLHDVKHATLIVETLRHRCRMVMQARDVRYVSILKNHGPRSGASIRHPHFQLIATAVVPPLAGIMVERQEAFAKEKGKPLFETLVQEEISAGERIVSAGDDFVTLTPWASQMAYEMWVVPRRRVASFGDLPDEQIEPFAAAMQDALRALHRLLDEPDYNLVIHSAPRGDRARQHHCCFAQILPRLGGPAGFEMGTGMYINHVPPESAAAALRARAAG